MNNSPYLDKPLRTEAEAKQLRKATETRKHYLDNWQNDSGLITQPGKFEGEMIYAPYFYNAWCEGDGEEIQDGENNIIRFHLEDIDFAAFPELVGADAIDLWESDDGFVYCNVVALSSDD